MSLLSTLYSSYSFTSTVSDGIEVIYSYNMVDPIVSYIDIGYTYSDPNEDDIVSFVYGRKSPFTQQILNNFPQWMELRKNYNSNGSKLVNAWGQNLERVLDYYATLRKDQFLSTADTSNNIDVSISELTGKGNKIYTPIFQNFLYNSSFSMRSASRLNKPLGWTANRDNINCISFDLDNSIFGTNGILLDGTKGKSQLDQTRQLALAPGPLTLSIFVKTVNDTGLDINEVWDNQEASLILTVWYADNTIQTYGVNFPKNTKNKWTRASLTANLSLETYKISVHIINRTQYKYSVDCPMLAVSKIVTQWTPSKLDVLPFTSTSARSVAGVQVLFDSLDTSAARKLEVFPVSSEVEFKYVTIPTRIEAATLDSEPGNYVNNIYSRHINAFQELMPCHWSAVNGYIQEQSAISPDIFSKRKPADLMLDEEGNIKLDISLINSGDSLVKAVCAVDNYLYVVTSETYGSTTKYFLKIVDPRVVNYSDVYMPSIGDLEIPIQMSDMFGPQSTSEDIVRIGVCKNIPGHIFIDTSLDRRLYYKLFYDYYYADYGKRRVYCRENYSAFNGHLQII